MLDSIRTALRSRALPSLPQPSASYPTQLRRYSQNRQQPSATGSFYKTFTRPVAKCALLAVLTYQLVYFGWTKLEHDEIRAERQAEITRLEAQVRSLQSAREAETEAEAAAVDVASENAKREEGGSRKGGRWWRW
ncbi:hypothetical protein MFIFM68171_04567 [Madurella fahalii]|uniref:Uncharacterized protein n=1 Tax=Madurella fahalii TaxID=1157608 RepID=A0ABQ0G9C7_9PEZI